MRIAYVCFVNAFALDGVNEKIASQVACWREAGHEVELLCLSHAPPDPGTPEVVPAPIFTFVTSAQRARATVSLARRVRRWSPDVIYLRYDKFLPPLPALLAPLPVVVEINTDDRRETALRRRRGWLYNELSRRPTLRGAVGLVCVTHELAGRDAFARYGKPTLVLGNGADHRAITAVPAAGGPRSSAVLLIGALAPWFGLDKVLTLARALPDLDVHLVGPIADPIRDRLPVNVHVHGVLPRDRRAPVLARADFGIGPLALHRKGMSEASPLKVREYLLHGLPVLTAHDDTDFLGQEPWFLLRLPNCEDNVRPCLPEIRAWASSVHGRRVPREEVVMRLSTDAKEARRLAFLAELVEAPGDCAPATARA